MATLIIPISSLEQLFRHSMPAPPSPHTDFAPIHVRKNPAKLLEAALRKRYPDISIVYPELIDDGRQYAERRRQLDHSFRTGASPPEHVLPRNTKVMIVERAGSLVVDRELVADVPGLQATPQMFAAWRLQDKERACYLTEYSATKIVISDEPSSPEREKYELWAHGGDRAMSAIVARRELYRVHE